MMYSAVSNSNPVSTNAEKLSNFPCPYGCFSSAGRSDIRTERKVIIAATKSKPECSASDSTPKLPVRITRNVLSETSTSAEATLSNAARFFSKTSSTTEPVITMRLDYRSLVPLAASALALANRIPAWLYTNCHLPRSERRDIFVSPCGGRQPCPAESRLPPFFWLLLQLWDTRKLPRSPVPQRSGTRSRLRPWIQQNPPTLKMSLSSGMPCILRSTTAL